MPATSSGPMRTLTIADAVFVTVGIVMGAGIFKAPSLAAAHTPTDLAMLSLWAAGGVIALIGALCYAELASTYPSTGGDYHYLRRAFGTAPAFLFAWARLTVMQTGSIALLAYVFGDYASQIAPLGAYSAALYAALAVVVFTVINIAGIREGKGAQRAFTSLEIAGVLAIALLGLTLGDQTFNDVAAAARTNQTGAPSMSLPATGLAMVFVLLTYGGWNEAAYVSAEIRGPRQSIARALMVSIALITALYLLVNLAYVKTLGHAAMANSDAVAADAMHAVLGDAGSLLVSFIVAVSALTSINATIITGARCNHALGCDFAAFGWLNRWNRKTGTPTHALLAQGAIALLLVGSGALARSGFVALVEYTAPVFWLFFLLTGLALFRLRWKDPTARRPFSVPLYPLTPILFCLSSAYMLWSSVSYTGFGALIGVAVLLAGLPVLWFTHKRSLLGGYADDSRQTIAQPARERNVVDDEPRIRSGHS